MSEMESKSKQMEAQLKDGGTHILEGDEVSQFELPCEEGSA